MTRQIRIGLLFEYPSLNGGEYSLLAVLKELSGQVHCLAFAPGGSPVASALTELSIDVFDWDARTTTDADLSTRLSTFPVDVWHANSLAMSRRLGRLASQSPMTATGHLRDIMKLSRRAIDDINHLQRIICVSQATRNFHISQGLSADRSCVVHNGIDLTRFSPAPTRNALRDELQLPYTAKLVLNVGQICLRKGQDTFVRVAIELARRDDSLHFIHCGARHSTKAESIAFDQQLNAGMQAAGLGARWHRLGIRDDLPELLREANLLLHCARQEPLGRVLLEALASGTPIVATRVGGTAEILRDGHEGLLAEPDDVPQLVIAARTLLDNPDLRDQLTRQGRRRCESLFSVERAARETLDIWSTSLQMD